MGFLARLGAMIRKEALQLRRDGLTFAMMFGMPIMQLLMFGYAINNDPKGLPTAILSADHSAYSRRIEAALANTGYFAITRRAASEADADALLQSGEVQFVVNIPANFTRHLVRGEAAQIDIEADATDPSTTGNALASVGQAVNQALAGELTGPLAARAERAGAVQVVLHRRYNPENSTQFNIVPGLLGIILTMTTVLMTALAVTRERERGTMENLLAMPVRPLEVMIGKIAPYIVISAVQMVVILFAARVLFGVPILGSLTLLALATLLFVTVNLAIGFTFSTLAQNQLQAMQMSFFFMMPSILLSGFAFPFAGMPLWARVVGEALPTTHFLRVVRALMLKGADLPEIGADLVALGLLLLVVAVLALSRYRDTLD
jgi:ABC-2 type transport system permease protein